jgi:pimeloyl-ACP methyl ester carboxylesterase
MFMIHPGGGGCEVYLPLAKKLESEFSCYGVDYYNLYHDEKIGSVKEIALYYLSEMNKIWEDSDREAIHLLGWSLGGQIALEIAYQLEQTGRKNIQLYVLDTILNDEYLETLGSYEDLEKRKELFAKYAKGLGYNQEYVDKVRANIHMESILGMQKISGNLDAARIVLFKAMMEDKTLSEVMSRHHEINHYVEQMKFNNIDKVIVHPEKLVLYEVPNTDHGSILEQLEFLVPKIASHKVI